MEKIEFTLDNGEVIELYVLEQAKLSGNNYILVTDEPEGDGEAMILKETASSDKNNTAYEIVSDDDELNALATLFESLLEDVDIES